MRAKYGEAQSWLDMAANHKGDSCLEWPFAKYHDGYGIIRINGKTRMPHRVICEAINGPSPTGRNNAAHSCGNSSCCNPRHLRWATAKENTADKYRHGTMCCGEDSPSAKLTADKVLAIRADSRPLTAIAAEYGVSANHAWMIKKGRKWAWLNEGVSG